MNLLALVFILGFGAVDPHPSPGRDTDLTNKRSKRAISTNNKFILWDFYGEEGNYIIPYTIKMETNPSLYGNVSRLIETAIEEYHRHTCIRFRPRTTEEQFITIRIYKSYSELCGYNSPGHYEGFNWVNINLFCGGVVRSILHELFHKVMFGHEHTRPDRDDYIRNYEPDLLSDGNPVAEYKLTSGFDIFSISNYPHKLKHPNDKFWPPIHRLSHDDIKAINAAYLCPDTLEGRGCYKSNLPTVVNGSLYPIREIYEPMEAVRLICNNGYIHERPDEAYSYCENGQFTPRTLTCKKVECTDDIKNCRKIRNEYNTLKEYDFCDVVFGRNMNGKPVCRKECGRCGDNENFCTQYPIIYGYGQIFYGFAVTPVGVGENSYYVQGEKIYFVCDEGFTSVGPTVATCINGTFDVDHFQCVASNPPNGDEMCNRVGDYPEFFKNKCSRLELDVGPGRLVPDQGCYNNKDFVQVKCDDGFRPAGSDLAQCQDGKWIHTMLKCIPDNPDDCKDTSSECEGLKLQGFCESADRIGFMRKRCQSSCGWCGKCQGTPIFERMKSELSPIKFAYENGENITLKCFPGWKTTPGKSSSQCQNGRFNPPELHCEPNEEVCVYSRGYFGEKEVTPNMLYYPNRRQMTVKCLKDYASRHQVTCKNGKFVPENFYCPYKTGRACDVMSLLDDTDDMHLIEELYGYYGPFQYQLQYKDGEEFQIPCDNNYDIMNVTCNDGVFTYQSVCTYKGIKASCSREDLPVYGNGIIEPLKDVYNHSERIYLKCAEGSSSISHPRTVLCNNGTFFSTEGETIAMICSEDGCSDDASDCQCELCDEEEVRERCRLTCGVCEGLGCSTSSIGALAINEYKEVYRNGEIINVTCELFGSQGPRQAIATCVNGQFDKPLCPAQNDAWYEWFRNINLLEKLCDYFENCENRLYRFVCSRKCHERLAAKELAEEG